jgi:hypothetical protein
VPDRAETALIVRDALAALWPARFDAHELTDDTALGGSGLGLDSVEIVELVLHCGERVGIPGYDADDLLASDPLTLGLLIDHLAAA